MSDDILDSIPSFARVSVAAVLVFEGEDPDLALAAAGITDPIAVEVRIGDTLDPSDGLFGDGDTPNLTAVLQTARGADDDDGQSPDHADIPRKPVQSVPGVAANLPPAFGTRPVAPVRARPR